MISLLRPSDSDFDGIFRVCYVENTLLDVYSTIIKAINDLIHRIYAKNYKVAFKLFSNLCLSKHINNFLFHWRYMNIFDTKVYSLRSNTESLITLVNTLIEKKQFQILWIKKT